MAANVGRPVLILAGSEEAAERYAKDARCFTDEPVVHLPSRGLPYGDWHFRHRRSRGRPLHFRPRTLRRRPPFHEG